jgi:hypothetical protein
MIRSRRARCAYMGERIKAQTAVIWKPESNKPLGKSRRTWNENIKTDLKRNRV